MNDMKIAGVFVALMLAATSMVHAQAAPRTCLSIRLVPGEADPARWGTVHHPPDTIAVDSAALANRSSRGFPIFGRDPHRRRGMAQAAGDSVTMTWSNGLAGVHLRGVVKDSTSPASPASLRM